MEVSALKDVFNFLGSDWVGNFSNGLMGVLAPWVIIEYAQAWREKRESDRDGRRIEREENYSRLQGEFRKAAFWLADHPEVNRHNDAIENAETAGQQLIFYSTLVSLFEESFLLFHKPDDPDYQRLWNSWADYINEWIARKNFRAALPELLHGEDPEFVEYMKQKVGFELAEQISSYKPPSPDA